MTLFVAKEDHHNLHFYFLRKKIIKNGKYIYMDYLKDLIFEGSYEKDFLIDKYQFTIGTLYALDEKNVFKISKYMSGQAGSVKMMIEVLSTTIRAINGYRLSEDVVRNFLNQITFTFIVFLYDCYKEVNSFPNLEKDYNNFIKTHESSRRWELYKLGYKFSNSNLNSLQQSWLYYQSQEQKNQTLEKNIKIADYVINHITHATINPKSYVKFINSKKDEGTIDENKTHDLVKDLFQDLKVKEGETKVQADIRVRKDLAEQLKTKDDHDLAMKEHNLECFKNSIRKYKLSRGQSVRPTVVIGKKKKHIEIGLRQSSTLDDAEVVKELKENPYFVDNVNYENLINCKAFIDIEDKQAIFEAIIEEKDSKKYLDNPELSKNETQTQTQVKEKVAEKENKATPKQKTLRELIQEKGMDLDQASKLKLSDLGEKNGR